MIQFNLMNKNKRLLYPAVCLCLALLLNGCVLFSHIRLSKIGSDIQFPEVLRKPSIEESQWSRIRLGALKMFSEEAAAKRETQFMETPKINTPSVNVSDSGDQRKTAFRGKPVAINLDSLPLPAFVNEVYGNILKTSFEIESSLRSKNDLVTLRTEGTVSLSELDSLARQVLENYGVSVERQGDLLRFVPGMPGTSGSGEPPLLISGLTLPEVPISHRPVFQMVPLKVVRNVHVAGWLKQAYKGQKLEILEDPERNAVLLMGTPDVVGQALKAIRVLDQPYMRGRHSVRIEPVFLKAEELAGQLSEVLNSEGYSATLRPPMGSIIILPVKTINAVLVFAADNAVLEHVKDWAGVLDRPGQKIEDRASFFYYQVQNTRAAEMAKMLQKILSGVSVEGAPAEKTEQTEKAEKIVEKASANAPKLVVDEARNGLIFQGDLNSWERLLPVIHEMDCPVRMVLIEVTIAQVTLTNEEGFGVEWLLKNLNIENDKGILQTLGGLGIGSGGLTYTLNNAGQTRAILNAFASKNRMTILSTPRIMVKSGGKATIDVGTEVPIITKRSTSSDLQEDGNSSVLQEIQYRKTGVLLSVSPVIHSGSRIDLEISQEVSESQPNTTSDISSPNIFTRRINTGLGLKDGGSVLLGGLISTTNSKGYSGIPLLSEIPVLGHLFRVEKDSGERTELIMLIVPYIIDSSEAAEAVTESFQNRLQEVREARSEK
jgi:general secretion pathway protein D